MLAWPASVMPSINMRLKNRVVLLITIPVPKNELELGNTDAVTEWRRMICKIPLLSAWKF